MGRTLIRFKHLRQRHIVENWPQLKHLVETEGFPAGFYLGQNSRAWFEDEVDAWLQARPTRRQVAA